MRILLKNIKQLIGILEPGIVSKKGEQMKTLESIDDAYLIVEDGLIHSFGTGTPEGQFDETIDINNGFIYPCYVDSHTHLVFANSREEEFQDRINGLSYEQIAKNGGGILNSARKLADMSEDELLEKAKHRLEQIIQLGTGAVEIKSGYGLSLDAEIKILRVIKKLKAWSPVPIRATFLGAHALPEVYKENREGYIRLIIDQMLPLIAQEQLADYIDVFCEKGYFSVDEMDEILTAGAEHGLVPKVHVNQFNSLGGIKKAVQHNAKSVDHLEVLLPQDLDALSTSETMPVLLPSCSFFLGIPYGPARDIINANLPLVLASDFNPGSTPSGNLNFVFSLACIQMKLNPEEALNALTVNAAAALDLESEVGSITVGKKANLIWTKPIKNLAYIPYSFGENCIEQVLINGRVY
jgi:imidazolonepropionase